MKKLIIASLLGLSFQSFAEPTIESNELDQSKAFTSRVWTAKYLGQYRIPSIVETKHHILLAFAEKRDRQGDQQGNDIVLKRSLDGGRTWGVEQLLLERGADSLNNPSSIVTKNNLIAMLYNVYPSGYNMKSNIPLGSHIIETNVIYSANNGLTWTKPINISSQVTPADAYLINSGPGTGSIIKNGEHSGRAILGAFAKYSAGKDLSNTQAMVIYNDSLNDYIPQPSGIISESDAELLSQTWTIGNTNLRSRSNEISVIEYGNNGYLYYLGRIAPDNRTGGAMYDNSLDSGENWNARYKKLDWFPYRTQSGLWKFDNNKSITVVHTTPVGSYSYSKGRTDGRIIATKDLYGNSLTWTNATFRTITNMFFSNSSAIEINDPIFKKQRIGVLYEGNTDLRKNKVKYINFSNIDLDYIKDGYKYTRPSPY